MSKEYDKYLANHIGNVVKGMTWLVSHGIAEDPMLAEYVVQHDSSKYSSAEYEPYDDYFYGNPNRTKEDIDKDFDYAWLHHIHHNPHHWQHWLLKEDDGELKALEMPEVYVYEMIADWWAFSWNKNDLTEIFPWYEEHKPKMILHPNTLALVESILDKIKNELDKPKPAGYSLLVVV